MKTSFLGYLGLALAGFGLFGCAGQAPSMAGFVAQGSYTSYALSGHYPQFNTESTDAGGSYRMDAPDVVSISTFFGDSFRYGLEIGMNGTPAAVAGYRTKSLAGFGWVGGNKFGWIGGLGALETVYHKGSWAADILSNLETVSIYETIGENQVSEIKNSTLTEQVGVKSYPELGIGGVAEFPRGSLDLRLGEDPLERVLRAYITLSTTLEWTRL
jgi:hypothetical protein